MTEAPQGTHSLAFEHVLKGRRIVARQRQLIDQIRARGGESAQAEDLLVQFERTLAIFEDDLAVIAARTLPSVG